jgi:hypothetical protein
MPGLRTVSALYGDADVGCVRLPLNAECLPWTRQTCRVRVPARRCDQRSPCTHWYYGVHVHTSGSTIYYMVESHQMCGLHRLLRPQYRPLNTQTAQTAELLTSDFVRHGFLAHGHCGQCGWKQLESVSIGWPEVSGHGMPSAVLASGLCVHVGCLHLNRLEVHASSSAALGRSQPSLRHTPRRMWSTL